MNDGSEPLPSSSPVSSSVRRYLKRVRIENFQGYSDQTVEFDPGVNLLVGTSNSGKSTILRAILWVLHNNRLGDEFIRFGSSEARVTLEYSDGTTVQRLKSRSGDRNSYVLHTHNGENYAFDKVGGEVPEKVSKACHYPPIDDRHGPISFSHHNAPLFLVSLSPTQLPRALSDLAGVSDLEEAAQILGKRGRQSDRQKKETAARLEGYQARFAKLPDPDVVLAPLKAIEASMEDVDARLTRVADGNALHTEWSRIMRDGRIHSAAKKRFAPVAALAPRLESLHDLYERQTAGREMLTQVSLLDKKIEAAEDRITKMRKVVSLSKQAKKVSAYLDRIARIRSYINEEAVLTAREIAAVSAVETARKSLNDLRVEQDEIASRLGSLGVPCPTCGATLAIPEEQN